MSILVLELLNSVGTVVSCAFFDLKSTQKRAFVSPVSSLLLQGVKTFLLHLLSLLFKIHFSIPTLAHTFFAAAFSKVNKGNEF